MADLNHPFETSKFYELTADGNIRITDGDQVGLFTTEGRYLSGDIRESDPQLCVWVGNNPVPETQAAESHLTQNTDLRPPRKDREGASRPEQAGFLAASEGHLSHRSAAGQIGWWLVAAAPGQFKATRKGKDHAPRCPGAV